MVETCGVEKKNINEEIFINKIIIKKILFKLRVYNRYTDVGVL